MAGRMAARGAWLASNQDGPEWDTYDARATATHARFGRLRDEYLAAVGVETGLTALGELLAADYDAREAAR